MTLTGTKKHINKSQGIYSATQNLAKTQNLGLASWCLTHLLPRPMMTQQLSLPMLLTARCQRSHPHGSTIGSSCSLRQAQAFHKRSKAIGLSCWAAPTLECGIHMDSPMAPMASYWGCFVGVPRWDGDRWSLGPQWRTQRKGPFRSDIAAMRSLPSTGEPLLHDPSASSGSHKFRLNI